MTDTAKHTHPRRRRGTGSIDPLPDGRWRPRLPLSVGGARLDACSTYDDAAALLDAALAEIAAKLLVPVEGVTLRAWGTGWLDDREHSGIEDIGSDRSRWKVHIEAAAFIDWPIASIRSVHVRDWLATMLKKRAAPGHGHKTSPKRRIGKTTVKNTLNLLRCAFEAAVERELIAENPAAEVHLPRQTAKERRTFDPWTYLLPAEQDALLSAPPPTGDPDLPDLVAFLLWTGVREGEAFCLELMDVHVDSGSPHAVIRFGKRSGSTKGGRIRRVPLFGLAIGAVRRQLERLGVPGRKNEHRLLWPALRGSRRAEKKAPRHWPAFLLTAGIVATKRHDRRPVRFHDLRHSCASSLVAGWHGRRWSLQEVRELLGHRSITTTERYAHLAESALHEAALETHEAGRSTQDKPRVSAADFANAVNHWAPPALIEKATFGLGKRNIPEDPGELSHLRGLILGLSQRGIGALEAVAAGGPGAWRVVQELLVDLIRAGEQLDVAPVVDLATERGKRGGR